MKMCDYGCGQEANFYFKTVKKWCCSKHFSQCPNQKNKYKGKNNSMYGKDPWNKGKTDIYSEETLKKFRKPRSTKGKKYEEIYGQEKAKVLKKQRSDHFKRLRKEKSWNAWNKGLTKETDERIKEYSKMISETKKYKMEDYIEKYPTFIKTEKPKFENDQIIVKCKMCNKWFKPKQGQLNERLRRFDRNYEVSGNSYFYCSDECKNNCEEFGRQVDPKQLEKFKRYNSLVYRETYKTLKKYSNKIKNLHLRGNKHNYELDHRYSIYEGFINNIPPKRIAHHKNLRVIPKKENRQKKFSSSITLETLLSFK